MLNEFLQQNRQTGLIVPGDQIICAVSGGADSMALLWCLYRLKQQLQITVSALHCNHHLRPGDAEQDAAFVESFCQQHHIPLQVCDLDVAAQRRSSGQSEEEAARTLRYACFEKALPAAAKIATAHNADDNLETTLIRLVRGTSPRGLSGIPLQRGRIIRPLLFATRTQILAFLQQEQIPHREDATNAEDCCLRNRLRHHVMPLLRQENPSFAQNWLETAAQLRQEDGYLSELAAQAMQTVRCGEGFSICALQNLEPVLQRRVLFGYLSQWGLTDAQLCHVKLLQQWLTSSQPSGSLSLPGLTLRRRYDCICPASPQDFTTFAPCKLTVPGRTELPQLGCSIVCRWADGAKEIENTATTFAIKYAMITQDGVWVRPRQAGDRITRTGGSRSVKRLLIDCKIPAAQRDRIPIFVSGEQILAVGYAGINQACAADGAGPYLEIKIEQEEAHHEK